MEKPKILIVDDRLSNLIALETLLQDIDADCIRALSGNEALQLSLENEFACIILDVQMPGMNGFEVAEFLRMKKDTEHIPIIFVTAISKEDKYIFKGYEVGAVDYIFKPIEPIFLKSKVKVFLKLFNQRRELEQVNNELRKLSLTDVLTGLPNRRGIIGKIEYEMIRCKRYNRNFCIVLGDIDHFKRINDNYGHDMGDEVLKQISSTIEASLREQDTTSRWSKEEDGVKPRKEAIASRWGGEEFLILLPETDINGGIHVADKIRQSIEKLYEKDDVIETKVTMSFGVAGCEISKNIEECIKVADIRLYQAKEKGRNRVVGYTEGSQE